MLDRDMLSVCFGWVGETTHHPPKSHREPVPGYSIPWNISVPYSLISVIHLYNRSKKNQNNRGCNFAAQISILDNGQWIGATILVVSSMCWDKVFGTSFAFGIMILQYTQEPCIKPLFRSVLNHFVNPRLGLQNVTKRHNLPINNHQPQIYLGCLIHLCPDTLLTVSLLLQTLAATVLHFTKMKNALWWTSYWFW